MNGARSLWEGYNDTQRSILSYLNSNLENGRHFFKSKYIAQELGLSPKEVGTNMGILSEICGDLKIVRWSYSSSTTWLVMPNSG